MSDPTAPIWHNWSRSQNHRPRHLASPRSVKAVVALMQHAAMDGLTVRCVGSAHSFVPFWTDDVILSLDGLSGVAEVNRSLGQAKVGAGTKLHDMGVPLWQQGLSLPQQGDIDRQSLAGALSTGTHGTGAHLRNLCDSIERMTLVTGVGEVMDIGPRNESELFPFACLCMGMLGVLVDVTLKLDAAYYLHENTWDTDVAECERRLPELIAENRHIEFFWVPRTDRVLMKTLNKTTEAPCRISATERIGPAYEIFPSERKVTFNEMEYAVPLEQGWTCFTELREVLLRDFPELPWPVEYRTLAADELPLSPAYQRDSVTLSVHQGADRDVHPLFDAAETIFERHQGRPHWGKWHSKRKEDLITLYPRYEEFLKLRERMDPENRFLNGWLNSLVR